MEPYIDLFLTRMLPVGIAFIITLKTNQLLRQAGYRLARRYKLFLGWTGWMLMLVTFYVLGTIFWGKADVLPWAISGVCCTGLAIGTFTFVNELIREGDDTIKLTLADNLLGSAVSIIAFVVLSLIFIHFYLNTSGMHTVIID